jgi:hypothetical protein
VGPPPDIGGDADCDGIPDDTTDFVYVTTTGNDRNPGTLVRPKRTIQNAIATGQREGKDVLVARGVYDGEFDVVGGVNVFGGYRPDFRDRDLELYPVLVERRDLPPGSPVLTCRSVVARTRIEGFIVGGTDAVAPGEGSTGVYLDRCGPAVELRSVTILAGRGADGARGDDSSDNLTEWGLSDLDELNGTDGRRGADAPPGGCALAPGGTGGRQSCRASNVSGGNGGAADCPGDICRQGAPCGNAGCTDFTVGGVCDLAAALRIAVANPPAGPGRGGGGGAAGELTYNAPTNRGICNFCDDNPTLPRNGGIGGDGSSGTDGGGGLGCSDVARVDFATGRVTAGVGTDGTAGSDGAGGGGGTAGGGYEVIAGTTGGPCDDRNGGAGGGGGSGGCGAPGADGGGGGGVSTGVLVRLASGARSGPSLSEVRIVTASGGLGGDGGIGARGGRPGTGALGGVAAFWCARTGGRGGDGGRGGAGGGGGGGCGGGSHGIFIAGGVSVTSYVSTLRAGTTIDATGVAGMAGRGGFSPGASGTDGVGGSGVPIYVQP